MIRLEDITPSLALTGLEPAAIGSVVAVGSINGPYYITHPFKEEPGWGVASVNFDLSSLLAKATKA